MKIKGHQSTRRIFRMRTSLPNKTLAQNIWRAKCTEHQSTTAYLSAVLKVKYAPYFALKCPTAAVSLLSSDHLITAMKTRTVRFQNISAVLPRNKAPPSTYLPPAHCHVLDATKETMDRTTEARTRPLHNVRIKLKSRLMAKIYGNVYLY